MDAGDEEKLCNMVVEVLLELGKPSTVPELAFHLKARKESVQRALFNLNKTGLVAQRDDRWLMAGSSEDIDEDTSLKVSEKERDLDRMGMRSRPRERGTQEKDSSLADHFGGLRMRSVSPERGAACTAKRTPSPEEKLQDRPVGQKKEYSSPEEKLQGRSVVQKKYSSPEEKLQGRPVGQKKYSSPEEKLQGRPVGQKKEYSSPEEKLQVVPVMNRSPIASTVGTSNMQIETRQTLQCALLSDPGVRDVHDNMMAILAFLSKSDGVEAKDVAQKCKLGDSRKGANPLLYFLEKKQLVRCEQVGTSHKKIWKIGTKKPSELEMIEIAAERSGVKNAAAGSSVSGPGLHLHNHYHQHTHKNFIQVGENNTMVIPEELEKLERVVEGSAEREVE
ncbi:hypothetical protein ACJMK2_012869 [Sinanodonta woodiana]|uniref:Uncharacterized protein n=1 Tax=Sinanodonta woodiana TaxID=1069815 RepID=A0ABD3VBG4_SINWO